MTTLNITTINGFTFSYEKMIINSICINNICCKYIYLNVVTIESNNPKFKKGDKIYQITVSRCIYFEKEDGTEY